MNKPFFSIIMPAYNRAKLIPKAIQSIISQEFTNWELCFVDDGSIDNTRDVVLAFNDPRINYIYQQNQERSASRNNGIRQAKGSYICFLDSDDYYLNTHLSTLYEEISKTGFQKAFYYTGLFSEDKNVLKKIDMKFFPEEHPVVFAFRNLLQCNAACIHVDLFKDDLFDERFMVWEDMHLWLRILLRHPFIKIDSYTAVMSDHADRSINGMFKTVSIKQIDNYMDCVNDFFDKYGRQIEPYISRKTYRDFMHKKLSLFAQIAIQNKQLKETVKLFFRIITNKPAFILHPQFTRLVLLSGRSFVM